MVASNTSRLDAAKWLVDRGANICSAVLTAAKSLLALLLAEGANERGGYAARVAAAQGSIAALKARMTSP